MDAPLLPASAPAPLPKRRLGCIPIALIVFGVCVGILPIGAYGFAVFYVRDLVDARTAEINRLRQQGIPTDPQELKNSYYTDPEAQRMGDTLVEIFGMYKASQQFYNEKDFAKHIVHAGEQPDAEHIEALRIHLDLNAEYMAELHDFLQEPHEVQYLIDFSQGFDVDIEFADDARIAVSMLAASANIAAMDGDIEGVVRDLEYAIRMSETLRGVPILMVQLIRNASVSLVIDQYEYAVNAVELSRVQLGEIHRLLDALKLDGMTALGLMGERCLLHPDMVFADESAIREATPPLGILQTRATFLRDVWIANLFSSQGEVIRIGDAAPWERRALGEQFAQKLDDQWSVLHILDLILLPPTVRSYEAENRVLSDTEIAKAGLAVLAYSQDTGALPDDLGLLVPTYMSAVPRDAFDGEPVRYKLTETGFVVYSIAHDRVDNGGVPPPDDKKIYETGDLVFRVLDASPYLQQKDAA